MSEGQSIRKHTVTTIIRVGIAALAMYLACRKEDWGATLATIKGINPVVVLLLLVFLFINQSIVAMRWYLLLRLQSINIGLGPALRLTLLGFYYNNCLPGSVGGDVLRAWYVTKHTPKRFEAVTSVFIDRLIGLAGLFVSAGVAYALFPKKSGIEEGLQISRRFMDYWWVLPAAVAAVAAVLFLCMLIPQTRQMLRSAYIHAVTVGSSYVTRFTKAIFLYCARPFWLLLFLLMTLVCQTIFIFGLWLVGRQLNITVGFYYYLVFIPVSWVIGMLPISIGGVGVMEGTLKFLFKIAGVEGNAALVLALCQRFAFLALSIPGMIIHMSGTHVPKEEFSVDVPASIN